MGRRQYISGFVRDDIFRAIEEMRKAEDKTRSKVIEELLSETPRVRDRLKKKTL